MRPGIIVFAIIIAAMGVCWGQARQAVVAPDGSSRSIDWRDTPITTDALVLYTREWGEETPDNRWALSCVVRGGVVVEAKNGAAAIPQDGYVLTGHGDSASWLGEHLAVGDEVQLRDAPPFEEERYEREVDAIDPDTSVFPSGRGPDQLVIYTPAFGERTGTNIFGSESIVRDGRIVARSGGDSPIPGDGFVISGHGRGSSWNVRHCPVGARVELDGTRLLVTVDREAHFLRVEHDIDRAADRIAWAEAESIDCPLERAKEALATAGERLEKARSQVETEPAAAAQTLREARRAAWTACARASETRLVEARGVWMSQSRVLQSAELRRDYLARLASANITMILPLARSVIDQPNGEQLLHDLIRDAHSFGIEVHPWTWLPGHSIPRTKDARRLEQHPEWADVSASGERLAALDPANPEVREALVSDAVWLATNFDIDGLHMDWEGIRGGFSEISRAEFEQRHGYDPLGDEGPTGPERVRDLYLWRVALIDRVVTEVVDALRGEGVEIPVSSAVQCFSFHPNIPSDTGASQQWPRWCRRGQLDIACPMIYSQSVEFVAETAGAIEREIGGSALHYAGLILYPETARGGLIEPWQLLEQIDAVREAGAEGIILFAAQQLFSPPWTPDDRLLLTLREGPFRQRATLPHQTWQRRPLRPELTVPYLYAVAEVEGSPAIEAGKSADLTVRVTNWGSEVFVVHGARVGSPRGWQAEALLDGPLSIEPGDAATVSLRVTAPADAEVGETALRLSMTLTAGAVEKSISVSGARVSVQ